MTYVLHIARISTVKCILCVDKEKDGKCIAQSCNIVHLFPASCCHQVESQLRQASQSLKNTEDKSKQVIIALRGQLDEANDDKVPSLSADKLNPPQFSVLCQVHSLRSR